MGHNTKGQLCRYNYNGGRMTSSHSHRLQACHAVLQTTTTDARDRHSNKRGEDAKFSLTLRLRYCNPENWTR